MNSNEANYSRRKARKMVKKIHPFIRSDQHVHHLDGNPLNNAIENLCILPRDFHLSFHNLGKKRPPQPHKPANLKCSLAYLEKALFFYNNRIWG